MEIASATTDDRSFLRAEMIRHWTSPDIYSRGRHFAADQLPALIALSVGRPVGHLTFHLDGDECEVVTLSATTENQGVGTALLARAVENARQRGCRRVFLTTSNDNLRALAFYQKRGWRMCAIYPGMIDRYREIEKEIPLIGLNGIPLHDEIELEFVLSPT